jgi:ABC-2 type transport system ATP-binding protein
MRRLAGPVIQVRSLARGFGHRPALRHVDLTVCAGEVHGLLGPGGAGKTTLLRVLAGLLPPTEGTADVLGLPAADEDLRRRVGLVSADGSYQGISGLENLVFAGRLHGASARAATQRAREVLLQVGLGATGEQPVGEWTSGMRMRLAFARALLTDPDVLLIDEPPEPVDAPTHATVRRLASGHARSGAAVIWATRRLDSLRDVAGDVTLLAAGRARYSGSVAALALRALAEPAEDVADRIRSAA